MSKEKKKLHPALLYILLIFFTALMATFCTFIILLVWDYLQFKFFDPSRAKVIFGVQPEYNPIGLFDRTGWTATALVFAGSFIFICLSNNRAVQRSFRKDEMILTGIKHAADEAGKNASVSVEDDESFNSTFDIDSTTFTSQSFVQRIPQRGPDECFCVAKISFDVPGVKESFYIEKKERFARPDIERLSITPLSAGNATQKLDGKYDYTYSDYRFFNTFLADGEISEELLSVYENFEEQIKLVLENQIFTLETRSEVSSDMDSSREDSSEKMKSLYGRVQKYYRRFQNLGWIEKK